LRLASGYRVESFLRLTWVFAAVTKVAQTVVYFLRVTAVLIVLTLLLGSDQSLADWPEHPITIIAPFPPGGATDLIGRLLATELAQRFGEKVSVENLAGEVGNIGLGAAALARPDGYTLLVTTNAALINLMINPKLSATAYDTPRDFAPIAYLGSTPNVIVTGQSSGIGSIAEFIAKAKASPGKLSCASPGVGSSSGMAVDLLRLRAGIDIAHIPFDGSDLAMRAAISGAADAASIGIGGMLDHIRSGDLKALVQTGSERLFDLPDVPTMAEAGVPDAVLETSFMFAAPAGTPVSVVNKLTNAAQAVLQRGDIQAQMLGAGIQLQYEGPENLHERIMREIPVWREIVERIREKKS
jgi:tripartite-type tricarboxylate transporter receptor subunit TctC